MDRIGTEIRITGACRFPLCLPQLPVTVFTQPAGFHLVQLPGFRQQAGTAGEQHAEVCGGQVGPQFSDRNGEQLGADAPMLAPLQHQELPELVLVEMTVLALEVIGQHGEKATAVTLLAQFFQLRDGGAHLLFHRRLATTSGQQRQQGQQADGTPRPHCAVSPSR